MIIDKPEPGVWYECASFQPPFLSPRPMPVLGIWKGNRQYGLASQHLTILNWDEWAESFKGNIDKWQVPRLPMGYHYTFDGFARTAGPTAEAA